MGVMQVLRSENGTQMKVNVIKGLLHVDMCAPRRVVEHETGEIMSQKILELKQEHVVYFV